MQPFMKAYNIQHTAPKKSPLTRTPHSAPPGLILLLLIVKLHFMQSYFELDCDSDSDSCVQLDET